MSRIRHGTEVIALASDGPWVTVIMIAAKFVSVAIMLVLIAIVAAYIMRQS